MLSNFKSLAKTTQKEYKETYLEVGLPINNAIGVEVFQSEKNLRCIELRLPK